MLPSRLRVTPLLFALLLTFATTAPGDQLLVFHTSFDTAKALEPWTGASGALGQGLNATQGLLLENPDPAKSVVLRTALDPAALAGNFITLQASVKAEGISDPPNSWNGIKVMLILEQGEQKTYPQLALQAGAFDWGTSLRVIHIPQDLTAASLCLGLEKVSGKVWFDDIQIRIGRPMQGGRKSTTPFKGHGLPRLRGVMHGPHFSEKNIRDLALDWNANQVRWQLNWSPMKEAETWAQDLDRYDQWLDSALAECDKALDACQEYGINVLLDLHTPPGGRAGLGVCRMFQDKQYQDKLIEVWERIATRYKGRSIIYAYDLLNEPVEAQVAEGLLDWRGLATEVTRRIREIDPGKPVVFEPGPWGGPGGFDRIIPLDLDNVIYSFHMYLPHAFTHQGVHGAPTGLVYPGTIKGAAWDKEALRRAMRAAIDFQREFNVHIYVGEFSVIRWAPGNSAYRYLRDVIDLFEEYGWDWSYHAFREWPGWSVEHGPDPQDQSPSSTPTDREKLLRSWFAKNSHAPRVTGQAPPVSPAKSPQN